MSVVRPFSVVADELNQKINDMYEKFLAEDGKTLNIDELGTSEQFRTFALATAELQKVDLEVLSIHRFTFLCRLIFMDSRGIRSWLSS